MAKEKETTSDPAISTELLEVIRAVQQGAMAQAMELVKTLKSEDDEYLERKARIDAEAMAKATGQQAQRPHPGISAYSYPEGDLKCPRPDLKCRMLWVGFPLEPSTTTAEELELLNQMVPGEYPIHKTDGSKTKLKVEGDYNADGTLTELRFQFPVTGMQKHNLPSMVSMLKQALKVPDDTNALLAEIARMRQQVQAQPAA